MSEPTLWNPVRILWLASRPSKRQSLFINEYCNETRHFVFDRSSILLRSYEIARRPNGQENQWTSSTEVAIIPVHFRTQNRLSWRRCWGRSGTRVLEAALLSTTGSYRMGADTFISTVERMSARVTECWSQARQLVAGEVLLQQLLNITDPEAVHMLPPTRPVEECGHESVLT